MSNKMLIGPYIGDFKHEVTVFAPYVNYLIDSLDEHDSYIASHSNRSFLYDHIPNMTFVPIFSNITRDELNQKGYMHLTVNKSQYNQILKMIKNDNTIKDHYHLPYIKSTNTISYYQKEFKPFKFGDTITKSNKISFIPDKSEHIVDLYNDIKDLYDIDVIGDMSNGMPDQNILLQRSDYFEIVYKYMFKSIYNSLFVITNCPEWALICNLQNIPLLYWGDDSSMYKSDGIYSFLNDRIMSSKHVNAGMVKYMYENMQGE